MTHPMTNTDFPHNTPGHLAAIDITAIMAQAARSDRDGVLTPALQSLLHARGWLTMLAPAAAGGAELALPEAVHLEETLAGADGSVGWTVTLCAGAGWFAGFLEPDFAREIIQTPGLCVGGSGAPAGSAEREGDGYRLNGRWEIATGAPLATHFTLNAVLHEDGAPLLDAHGAPRVRAFIVPAAQVQVHPSWHSTGLRASASHAFSIDQIWVGACHGFDIAPEHATAPGPLYRFPFVTLAFVTLAANVCGMALRFLSLAAPLIAARRHPLAGRTLGELPDVMQSVHQARQDVASARLHFSTLLYAMWARVCDHAALDEGQAQALHTAALALVDTSRHAVDTLYPLCGLHAADARSDINRVWRDLHTATQHAMLLPEA